MNNILQTLKTLNTRRFKPIPFWSINSRLDKKEIIRQIGEMNSYGLGGFVFHARTGLMTEYLSEQWFEMVKTALSEAKRLDMSVWIYDENGWPSGFVGGKLLEKEENRAAYLTYKVLDGYDENAYAVYEYTEQSGARLLKGEEKIKGKYHTVYKAYSDAYTDILNPEVTDQFIAATHEKYYERFAESFGKELVGFFTDEPQYYRYATPISAVTEREFSKTYGYDVKEGLLYLFLQDESGYPFRVRYYNLMNALYCENYYKKLMAWCEDKGCLLTGHTVEETGLYTQMWGSADAGASYLYEHVPAIDNLEKNLTAEISAKLVGSVAAQTGKKVVCTETFGTSGYSTTPKQMKLIADKQYVYGVDYMVQHLYNYSLAGQGKIDCPPSFGRAMPWIAGYKEFNGYFEKLGSLIANSEECAPVAVVVPMESVYLDYIRLDERASETNTDLPFNRSLMKLRKAGVAYHFANEKVLEKIGSAENGKLKIGERVYDAIVVADCREIKSSTLSLLKKYSADGGKLCVLGDTPKYVDGVRTETGIVGDLSVEELPKPLNISADGVISYSYRKINGGAFLFVVNENSASVTVRTEKLFSRVDIIGENGYRGANVHVVPAESSVLLEENGEYAEVFSARDGKMVLTPEFISSTDNGLTLERVTAVKDDGESITGYNYGVFEILAKSGYNGNLRIEFRFESDRERAVTLTREKQDITDARLNGELLGEFTQAEEDINFEYAVLNVKKGENVYGYSVDFTALSKATDVMYKDDVPESIRNCFTYHTGMEQIYLSGDFDVEGYALKEKKPKVAGDLSEQGYGNFCGKVKYSVKIPERIENAYFKPVGNYSQCVLKVGGNDYRCMMEEGVFVPELPKGEVTVECYSTLRNKIGPFHFGYPYDDRVSERCFTLFGLWKSVNENIFYYEPKRVVPFGLNKAVITFGWGKKDDGKM